MDSRGTDKESSQRNFDSGLLRSYDFGYVLDNACVRSTATPAWACVARIRPEQGISKPVQATQVKACGHDR
jgi:hypothetical protein